MSLALKWHFTMTFHYRATLCHNYFVHMYFRCSSIDSVVMVPYGQTRSKCSFPCKTEILVCILSHRTVCTTHWYLYLLYRQFVSVKQLAHEFQLIKVSSRFIVEAKVLPRADTRQILIHYWMLWTPLQLGLYDSHLTHCSLEKARF